MDLFTQLFLATQDLGPTVAQGRWRQAEDPSCLAVQGLQILRHEVLLPGGVQIPRPSSPIIGIDEAEELYAEVMPGLHNERLLRPLLIRLMVANDRPDSTHVDRFTALWALFSSAQAFHDLRPHASQANRCQIGREGQAIVGSTKVYVRNETGLPPQILDRSWFEIPADPEGSRILAARDRDPAQWNPAHDRLFGDWRDQVPADAECVSC